MVAIYLEMVAIYLEIVAIAKALYDRPSDKQVTINIKYIVFA